MKATIYYVDGDRTNRDERWDAGMGKLLPPDKFRKAAVVELPPCFEPRDDLGDLDWRLQVCEVLFAHFNGQGKSVGKVTRFASRSMSVGDVIVLEGEPGLFFCDRIGFRPVEGTMEPPAATAS